MSQMPILNVPDPDKGLENSALGRNWTRPFSKQEKTVYWYFDAFKQFATFQGRSSRTAFWMFFLINLMVCIAIIAFEVATNNPGWIDLIYSLVTLLPLLALAVRRIRDTGLSMWWFAVLLVPGFGVLILLILLAQPSAQACCGGVK